MRGGVGESLDGAKPTVDGGKTSATSPRPGMAALPGRLSPSRSNTLGAPPQPPGGLPATPVGPPEAWPVHGPKGGLRRAVPTRVPSSRRPPAPLQAPAANLSSELPTQRWLPGTAAGSGPPSAPHSTGHRFLRDPFV